MSTSLKSTNTVEEKNSILTPEVPWLGLRPFTANDRNYFFGRKFETKELSERVLHRRLTILYGRSGLGKTSLLQAGVIPKLRKEGYEPIYIRFAFDESARDLEDQVIDELLIQLKIGEADENLDCLSLWELLHNPECGLVHDENGNSRNLVLIFDQFEELHTLGESKRNADVAHFMNVLTALVENRPTEAIAKRMEEDDEFAETLILSSSPVKLLITLRDDYLHWLERYRMQMPSMMDNRFELLALRGPEALEVVVKAAEKRRLKRPDQPAIMTLPTAEAIVRFVAGAKPDQPFSEVEIVPPLLNLVCEQLNRRRLVDKRSTIDIEDVQKSAGEVLISYYEDCFSDIPLPMRHFVEDELLSDSGYRESVTLDSAVSALKSADLEETESIIDTLVNRRLLSIDERGGVPRIELTHDILAPVILASRSKRQEIERNVENLRLQNSESRRRRNLWLIGAGILNLIVLVLAGGMSLFFAWRENDQLDNARQHALGEQQRAVAEALKASIAVKEVLAKNQEISELAKTNEDLKIEAERKAKEANDAAIEMKIAKDLATQSEVEAQEKANLAREQEAEIREANANLLKSQRESQRLIEVASLSNFHFGSENYADLVHGAQDSVYVGKTKWNLAIAFWAEALRLNPKNTVAGNAILAAFGELPDKSTLVDSAVDWHIPSLSKIVMATNGKSAIANDDTSFTLFKPNGKLRVPLAEKIESIRYSNNGNVILVIFESGRVAVWDAPSGKVRVAPFFPAEQNAKTKSISISNTLDKLVTVVSDSPNRSRPAIAVWQIEASTARKIGSSDIFSAKPVGLDSLYHDGFFVFQTKIDDKTKWILRLIGYDGKDQRNVELGTYVAPKKLPNGSPTISYRVFSNPRSYFGLFSENNYETNRYRTVLLDLASGKTVECSVKIPDGLESAKLSPEGRYLVAMDVSGCGGQGYLQIWNLSRFHAVGQGFQPMSLPTSTDTEKKICIVDRYNWLFVGSDQNTIEKWSLLDGSKLASYYSPSPVEQIVFDESMMQLAAYCQDRQIRHFSLRAKRTSITGIDHGLKTAESVVESVNHGSLPDTVPVNLIAEEKKIWAIKDQRQACFDWTLSPISKNPGTLEQTMPNSSCKHSRFRLTITKTGDSNINRLKQIDKASNRAIKAVDLDSEYVIAAESKDGTYVLLRSGSSLEVWDINGARRIGQRFSVRNEIVEAMISDDGRDVVVVHGRKADCTFVQEPLRSVTLFKVGNPNRSYTFEGEIAWARFAGDSNFLLVSGRDHSLWLACLQTGLPCSNVLKLDQPITDAVYFNGEVVLVDSSKLYKWVPKRFDDDRLLPDGPVSPEVIRWSQYVSGLRLRPEGGFADIPDDERREFLINVKDLPEPWLGLHKSIFPSKNPDSALISRQ